MVLRHLTWSKLERLMNTKRDHLGSIWRQPKQFQAKFQNTVFSMITALEKLTNQTNEVPGFGEDFNRHLQNTFEFVNLNSGRKGKLKTVQ